MDDKAKVREKEKTGATKEKAEKDRGREKGRKRRSSTGSSRSVLLYPYHSISCFYQTTYILSHCFLMPHSKPIFLSSLGSKVSPSPGLHSGPAPVAALAPAPVLPAAPVPPLPQAAPGLPAPDLLAQPAPGRPAPVAAATTTTAAHGPSMCV